MLDTEVKEKWIYRVFLLIISIQFLFYWLDIHKLFSSSISLSITAVALTICIISVFRQICSTTDTVFLMINTVFLVINSLVYGNMGANFELYNLVVLLILLNNISFSKKQVQNIRLVTIVLLMIFLISLNFAPLYETIMVHDMKDNEINTNTFGILYLSLFLVGFLYFDEAIKNKVLKFVVLVALSVFSVNYIVLSDSRTSLLSALLFIVVYLLKPRNIKNYRKMLLVMIIFVLAFPWIYNAVLGQVNTTQFLGKSITTRQLVWSSAIDFIKENPIIGSGTKVDMLSGVGRYTESAHNLFLSVWKTIGIVPMITLIRFLLKGVNLQRVSSENVLSKVAFFAVMLVSAFETALADSNTYIFFVILLLTIKDEKEIINDT